MRKWLGTVGLVLTWWGWAWADPPSQKWGMPLLFHEDFSRGLQRWRFSDPGAWRLIREEGNFLLDQYLRRSRYRPPFRSPLHIALIRHMVVSDFVLEARVRSTVKDYPHRDACLFFGYQSPSRFYYVHLGKRTDPHANQVFIVNQAPRTKISLRTSPGTPWSSGWHRVRIVRWASSGRIEVYFDDFSRPVMVAQDRTFTWGQVGIGTFDDTTQWDDVTLWGRVVLVAPRRKEK